jgi:hypothetical protein
MSDSVAKIKQDYKFKVKSMFNTMYRMEHEGIVYLTNPKSVKILFAEFDDIMAPYKDGLMVSEAMGALRRSEAWNIDRLYHLAAILQKLHPDIPWRWEADFISHEMSEYYKTVSTKVYMEAHGIATKMYRDDFDEWQFDLRVHKWFEEQGMIRDENEIIEIAKRKVQELIYDRSKTDFIDLSSYHEFKSKQQKLF